MRPLALIACIGLAACAATEHDHSAQPYGGQEDRSIKALSADEVKGYLSGAGMGFAKAAELNGYPGPMHSLENAEAMGLTSQQRDSLEKLMHAHKDEVRKLGEEVVRLERELDALFAQRNATPELVDAKLRQVAEAQARVRASHLKTHLATTSMLTPEQIERYKRLRGYANAS